MIERVEDHDKIQRSIDFIKLLLSAADKARVDVTMFRKSGSIHMGYEFSFVVPEQAYSDCTEIHLSNVIKGLEAVPHVF